MGNQEISYEKEEKERKSSTSWWMDYDKNLKKYNRYKQESEKEEKKEKKEAEFLFVDDISEKQYQDLCAKDQLTDDEVWKVVKYNNNNESGSGIVLSLTSLPVQQAKILSEVKHYVLLYKLENISDDAAEELSKQWESLFLPRLNRITDAQAKSFTRLKSLDLRWLKSITDSQAKELSNLEENLYLNENILSPIQKTILTRYWYDLPNDWKD